MVLIVGNKVAEIYREQLKEEIQMLDKEIKSLRKE